MVDIETLLIGRGATLGEALQKQDTAALGVLLLVDAHGRFERTITDGDLRRIVLKGARLEDSLEALPEIDAITLPPEGTPIQAMGLMRKYAIDHIPVIDFDGRPVKVYHRRELDARIYLSRPHLGGFEIGYIEDALDSNWVAPLGPNVDAFEREMAEYLGVRAAAAVVSGTAAIHLALDLLGVGPGAHVICSSLTFVASANPIVYLGATPIFVDSEPDTWNMSPPALRRALEWSQQKGIAPRAVIIVNIYGQSANYSALQSICDEFNVPVIEDAAESLGATYKDQKSGSLGTLGTLSFNGNKIITTSGGGMLVSDDEDLISRARFLSTQARDDATHYEHSVIGYNYRMSNVLAGIGRGQLKVLDERVRQRRQVFEWYRELLGEIDEISWMPEASFGQSNRWLTACTIESQDLSKSARNLVDSLSEINVEARPVWKPMHRQPLYQGAAYFSHSEEESVSDYLFDHGICLPSGSDLLESQVKQIADRVKLFFGS